MSLNTIFYLIIGFVALFWARNVLLKRQDINAGKRYCEENDLTFIDGRKYEQHIRLHFEKDGVKGWANYILDEKEEIKWIKGSPLEKLEEKLKEK